MVDSALLKYELDRNNLKQGYVAEKLKITQSTLSLKINNSRAFTIPEMFKLSNLMNLDLEKMEKIFNQ